MFGEQAEVCSSGWGLTQEMKTRLDIISTADFEVLKKIDKILKLKK